jgi:rubredoxin
MVEGQGPDNEPTLDLPEMVECPHCGFANLPNSNYCGRCGLSIFDTDQVEETPEPLPEGMGEQEAPSKSRLPPIYIIGFGAFLLE